MFIYLFKPVLWCLNHSLKIEAQQEMRDARYCCQASRKFRFVFYETGWGGADWSSGGRSGFDTCEKEYCNVIEEVLHSGDFLWCPVLFCAIWGRSVLLWCVFFSCSCHHLPCELFKKHVVFDYLYLCERLMLSKPVNLQTLSHHSNTISFSSYESHFLSIREHYRHQAQGLELW